MYKYLDKVNSPQDIKNMTVDELDLLAKDIRKFLVRSVSQTGGHLASNLGVVELTLALHKVFDSPKDKIVWDVGHQSYVHKIITGRKDNFKNLRQFNGMSGFPKECECEHDIFDTGHSSTSISVAQGLACARDIKKEESDVIAVIGDGSITGGMALEALNHVGYTNTDMIIILNDNEMSIDKNVGGMSRYLSGIIRNSTVNKVKDEVEKILQVSPGGNIISKTANKVKDSIISKFIPQECSFFESIGIKYYGPVDGHNTKEIIEALNKGDTLVVTTLDRFCRTVKEGLEIIDLLIDKGVRIHILNMGLIEDTPMGRLIVTNLLAFAEFERAMIVERTQTGKALAKTKEGWKEGRPKLYTKEQLDNALSMLTVNGGNRSYKEVERLLGISKSTLIRENNRRNLNS